MYNFLPISDTVTLLLKVSCIFKSIIHYLLFTYSLEIVCKIVIFFYINSNLFIIYQKNIFFYRQNGLFIYFVRLKLKRPFTLIPHAVILDSYRSSTEAF